EDESARLDAQHYVHLRIAVVVLESIDDAAEAGPVPEQRRDVVEEDAGLGKVGHLANECLEIWHTGNARIVTRGRKGFKRRGQTCLSQGGAFCRRVDGRGCPRGLATAYCPLALMRTLTA